MSKTPEPDFTAQLPVGAAVEVRPVVVLLAATGLLISSGATAA